MNLLLGNVPSSQRALMHGDVLVEPMPKKRKTTSLRAARSMARLRPGPKRLNVGRTRFREAVEARQRKLYQSIQMHVNSRTYSTHS